MLSRHVITDQREQRLPKREVSEKSISQLKQSFYGGPDTHVFKMWAE